MKKLVLFSAALALFACHSNSESADGASGATWESKISYDDEIHLEGIRQLTNGGDNAEAYFSSDNSKLSLQISHPKQGIPCDQIYMIDLNITSTGRSYGQF